MRDLVILWTAIALLGFSAPDHNVPPGHSRRSDGSDGASHEAIEVPPGGFKLSIVPMAAKDPVGWEQNMDAYQKARRLGCSVAHSYLNWGDIELDADTWDWEGPGYLPILAKNHGMQVSMELTIINVMTLGKLPNDLEGRALKDPALQERWLTFLQDFSRHFKGKIQYLWLGNEIDTYFDEHPDELDVWTDLYARSVAVVHREAPNMKVGTVMTYHGALKEGHTGWIDKWGPISDVIGVTYYPEMMPGGYQPDQVQKQFDDLIGAYGKYRLALVESAVSACDTYGGGEAAQAAFCTELFEALERHKDKLEFGGWFNLHDFPPAFLGTLTAGWGVDSTAFSCWLGGLALATFEGQPRPVYAQWAVEARKLSQEP